MKNKALSCAIGYLARREYGAHELITKLEQKRFRAEEIRDALANCKRLGLQNDLRYCEMVSRARIRQGYGPLRIRQELLEKRVDPELIEAALLKEDANWLSHARAVKMKKYKTEEELSFETKQKQKQFLYYRGFSLDIIAEVFSEQGTVDTILNIN